MGSPFLSALKSVTKTYAARLENGHENHKTDIQGRFLRVSSSTVYAELVESIKVKVRPMSLGEEIGYTTIQVKCEIGGHKLFRTNGY